MQHKSHNCRQDDYSLPPLVGIGATPGRKSCRSPGMWGASPSHVSWCPGIRNCICKKYMFAQRAHDTMITSIWCQNDTMASFWRHNDVIFTSLVRCVCPTTEGFDPEVLGTSPRTGRYVGYIYTYMYMHACIYICVCVYIYPVASARMRACQYN